MTESPLVKRLLWTGLLAGTGALAFYGSIEQVLTRWIFDRDAVGDDELEGAKTMIVETICRGLEQGPVPGVEGPSLDEDLANWPVFLQRPGSHRGAVAVRTWNADFGAAFPVDMTSRRSEIQPVPLARIDPGPLFVEAETLDPAGVLVDPGILHTRRGHPLERPPDVEQEGAILSGKRSNAVRAQDPPRQLDRKSVV